MALFSGNRADPSSDSDDIPCGQRDAPPEPGSGKPAAPASSSEDTSEEDVNEDSVNCLTLICMDLTHRAYA